MCSIFHHFSHHFLSHKHCQFFVEYKLMFVSLATAFLKMLNRVLVSFYCSRQAVEGNTNGKD